MRPGVTRLSDEAPVGSSTCLAWLDQPASRSGQIGDHLVRYLATVFVARGRYGDMSMSVDLVRRIWVHFDDVSKAQYCRYRHFRDAPSGCGSREQQSRGIRNKRLRVERQRKFVSRSPKTKRGRLHPAARLVEVSWGCAPQEKHVSRRWAQFRRRRLVQSALRSLALLPLQTGRRRCRLRSLGQPCESRLRQALHL